MWIDGTFKVLGLIGVLRLWSIMRSRGRFDDRMPRQVGMDTVNQEGLVGERYLREIWLIAGAQRSLWFVKVV